ncbi:MAG: UbiA family prenyltransferase [Caldilineaceae bacterium]|nr:UbiA family prenyltransferase [Caldilineaceae bacterium]
MLWGILRLLRLSNSLSASFLVLLGAHLTHTALWHSRLWLTVLAMWSITAFGYVSNDLSDQAEDQINKPDRPLPAARVTRDQARLLAAGLVGLALLSSSQLGVGALLVALGVLSLLRWYNNQLKGTSGLGNLLIAVLAGSALFPGVVAVYGWQQAPWRELWPAALALGLFVLAREILKTLEDQRGDQAAGKQTLALSLGVVKTRQLLAFLTLLLLLVVWGLGHWWGYAWPAIGLLLVGVVLPLGWSVYYVTPAAPVAHVRRALALLKGAYLVGLVALWLA